MTLDDIAICLARANNIFAFEQIETLEAKLKTAQKILDLVSTFDRNWNSIGNGTKRKLDIEKLKGLLEDFEEEKS